MNNVLLTSYWSNDLFLNSLKSLKFCPCVYFEAQISVFEVFICVNLIHSLLLHIVSKYVVSTLYLLRHEFYFCQFLWFETNKIDNFIKIIQIFNRWSLILIIFVIYTSHSFNCMRIIWQFIYIKRKKWDDI